MRNGKLVATVGSKGIMKLWQIELFDGLIKIGCNWMSNYLENNADSSSIAPNSCQKLLKNAKT